MLSPLPASSVTLEVTADSSLTRIAVDLRPQPAQQEREQMVATVEPP